ncbi:MAG: hypothetical protein P8L71_12575, partial [Flavobacteriales bacterium]|nr:hypothetical protein [Flavobacteriales bacterium]
MLLFLSFSPDNSTSPIQLADIGAICDLSIEVSTEPSTVCVPPLPPAEDNCDCNGKMQNLTLEYNGPAGATVTVYDDSGTLIATFANVQPGDILFVSAENLNDQEFEAWTSFYTNGGDVTWLHTSCSQDILGDTEGDFTVLGYTDGQGDQCGILGNENYQGCNGSADLTVSNGESPYTYLWSDGSISGDRNDLCAGEYEVTVTDANGCSSTADVVVESDTPEILISVETEANTVCDDSPNPNDCDCQGYIYEFEVEYNGASGILGGAYDYHDNTYLHDTLVTGQVYTFNVSNSNHPGEDHEHNDPMMWTYEGGSWIHHGTIDASCPTSIIGTSYGPFTVLGYTDVHGNVCSTATNCNGSADLTVSNGEAPYTYLWSDGSTSGDRDDLCAGEYQVTVTDANGCSTEIDVEITSDTQDVTAVADVTADAICPEFDVCDVLCFESSNGDDDVSAQMSIDIEEGPNTITLRTIYAKTFCDNTYGDNTIGWPGNHSFGNLRGSDKLELALYNENGDLSLQFELDYIDDEGQGPSGYGTGGVSEGDGDMIVGNEAYILDVKTSLSENFNTYGYVLTENSPATDADYTSNPDYPNWIYEVWYEVTIDLDAFGNSGFGYPEITDFHASPSKTGNNSEPVEFSECCGNGGVECTGSIDLTVTEGVAPFTFAWSNGETTEDIYNLCGGSYSVVVTDANGCSAEYTYEVTCNSTCEIECVNDLTLDCEASTDPNHTGYPTLVCGGYGDCDREAGEFDFAFHGWGGTPVGWGFGPGWQIGTGCDPECGNIPNVFIDFTNFHTDYDTKLKSPIYDACCTDNVYLSFCMQQDLYGGEDVPGFLDVQYRLNAGTWETVYTYNNVFGSTVNYNDTFEIPGAAGNAFEVRFRARGEGSSEFTLGGWGIDDVRVFGHSSGCDSPEEVDIDWSYSDSSNGSCPEVITRTFTGEYNGETFSCIQTLTIVDEEAPIFTSVPDDEEYPCSESIDPSSASAIDNCDDYVTITQSDQIIGFGCTYYIERTFVATDYCGNTASYIQTITINDTEAPEIDCPADVTVECTESLDPSNTGEPVVTDNCSEFDVTYSDGEVSDDCPATFERTWTATDACGNSSSCIQIITINDSEAPEIDCPADVTVECTESLDPSNTGEATATDDCSTPMISYVDGPMMGECPATFERTWTATDACGNSISCVQVITVDDTEAPEIECPADYIVNCDNGSSDPEFAGEPTVEDNCSEFEVTYVDGPATDDCPAVFVRTWTATDACGNASSCTQNITINDFAAPVITCPADVTVECTESLDPSNTGEATAMDDCSTPNVTYVDGPMTGDCPYTVERTWTAVDPCGNETSCVQTITIEDTVAPVLSGEDSMVTIECDASTQIVPPTATDNCDDQVSISMNTETIPGDCANEWTEVYTWTAMDECGNTDVRTFTVNYEDTTAPVLIGVPADDTIDCEAPVPSAIVVATDNCDNDVPVALTAETNYFDCGYEIVRTWTATDDCGNTTSMSQTLTVEDIVAPVITCPADYVVSCDNGSSDPEFSGEPTVEDNC